MTSVVSTWNLHRLASARVEKLTQLVLPPGHEPILDVMASIWVDGVEAGFQMAEAVSIGLSGALAEDLYQQLEGAELCSEYDEFPELDDRDFQDLACGRVEKISHGIHPVGHPDVIWDKVEIWTDGVAAALRIMRDEGQRQA
ncbi:hypothetical protein KV112_13230 [Mycolicibacter sp. MYC123]|uniref:DUF4259 domain-containing protein n=1 Tax=[Mycobacterium] zoologicum TaxID=2872311 RepID=A0ABU5YKX3_9MYCO|nr:MULTISPECIES: hypothetical protein [unclassified Mycolicibacter]MEB3050689.1 hypothetical protein [Mycolicibacter sp. MYC123]MEB3062800.1 hypothetical protein [Mycolicibacter sp. MYC101]